MNKVEIIKQKRYIELNSTFRNRNEYPNPAKFTVRTGVPGQKLSGITSLDPISSGFPVLEFQGDQITEVGLTLTGTPQAPRVVSLDNPDDFYNGALLVDTTISESSVIIGWNNKTKMFLLETPFGSSWTSGDAATITDPSDGSGTGKIYISGDPSPLFNTFVGQLLFDISIATPEYRTITDYDPLTKIITLDSPFGAGWAIDDYYKIVSSQALVTDSITMTTTLVGTLSGAVSIVDDFYRGDFISFFSPPNYDTIQTSLIKAYNGTTQEVTITPPITVAIYDFSIYRFTKDNASFLNYKGFNRSERGFYRITLDNLILPNKALENKFGNSTAFFPYVYVVFSNDSLGTSNLFNSNNPNSTRAVFRCPITDIPNPDLSTFIKIRSTMINVIRFNPYEDINFEVYLPDGTVFKTVESDTLPPERPNTAVQISCTIAYQKI